MGYFDFLSCCKRRNDEASQPLISQNNPVYGGTSTTAPALTLSQRNRKVYLSAGKKAYPYKPCGSRVLTEAELCLVLRIEDLLYYLVSHGASTIERRTFDEIKLRDIIEEINTQALKIGKLKIILLADSALPDELTKDALNSTKLNSVYHLERAANLTGITNIDPILIAIKQKHLLGAYNYQLCYVSNNLRDFTVAHQRGYSAILAQHPGTDKKGETQGLITADVDFAEAIMHRCCQVPVIGYPYSDYPTEIYEDRRNAISRHCGYETFFGALHQMLLRWVKQPNILSR